MIRLLYLSDRMGMAVYIHNFTGGWSDTIWIESKYADLIEKNGKLNSRAALLYPKRTAKAVYYLLHEFCHAKQEEYVGIESELEANFWAARHFKTWCIRLGYGTRTTERLWRSLPDYYRKPEYV